MAITWRSSLTLLVVALWGLATAACSFNPEAPVLGDGDNQWELDDNSEGSDDQDVWDGDAGADANQDDLDADTDGQSNQDNGDEPDAGPDPDGDPTPDADVDPEPDGDADPDPFEECGGQQVNILDDPNHCGGCDNACDPEFGVCDGGECACTDGLEPCGPDNRCEYLLQEPSHCGQCGYVCDPGMACQGGQCVCRQGFTLCDGACVDTSRDPNHCGGCGVSCGFGRCADSECGAGGCWAIGYRECEPDDSEGLACIPWTGGQNSLYCEPTAGNQCGIQCEGNEVCHVTSGCVAYRAARGCQECPCDDCTDFEQCVDDISTMDGVYCVAWTG